ncbi:PD-(D/E)XK motif protein [Pedobacter caeni]|uniref:Putative PD-(D/E)XK family member n=1 Tax=Pedobacter caeni TaxID=288992 RepID=A0A1M5JNI3_9SPHI|nr:PD-(D/E)XK motif protein [Pedobacter caeni]SHG42134.1 Putative PD-(D/E)XK family member [Pedobacter caeni]
MIDYRSIWNSLNVESEKAIIKAEIVRKIPSLGKYSVFLSTDFHKGIRLLYCKLNLNDNLNLSSFPRFKGLEISVVNTSIGEFKNNEFLKLKQSIPNTDIVFESVISDICQHIVLIESEGSLEATLIKVLNEWKMFFDMEDSSILSTSSQKGLFGELIFLKDHLFNQFSLTESLNYWTGADKTNHDFQIFDQAVEVKTTSLKQHRSIVISSEKQLDNLGLSNLYLFVLNVNIHHNTITNTLKNLVEDVLFILKDDSIASHQFYLKLLKYGYNIGQADQYCLGFSITETIFYRVIEGFPRLINLNIPNGVGELRYSVMLSACEPYKINSATLKLI